ncbi:hypothetical protein EVAR_46496_1 [Eumeta japonica]|uniref:Uncharacterized protein n=1 Tax=Eumeta variegata TaxID=151549 RepID=A0A4C1WTF3_EUMVA|nr:hypothetical protein EVAR_46496_1 [Eumeta japonica]
MALGGSFLKNATMLEQLLEEINFQRTKEMRQLLKDVSESFGSLLPLSTFHELDFSPLDILFPPERAGNALVTLELRVSMGGSDHLFFDGSLAHLLLTIL